MQRLHVALLTKKYIYYKPPRHTALVLRLAWPMDLKGNVRQAHSGVVQKQSAFTNEEGAFRHEAVWKYLFLHPVDKIGEAVGQDADCEMTP